MIPQPGIPLDRLDEEELARLLLDWAGAWQGEDPGRDAVDLYYQTISPRTVFLKNLAPGAQVLDMGAGDGGLARHLDWPHPARPDLALYALSLEDAPLFQRYAGVEIGDFEQAPMDFGGRRFDAAICAHFIEHMHSLDRSFDYLRDRLKPGARLYLEWPSPAARRLPPRADIIDQGLPVFISNFHDDKTHVQAWPMEQVLEQLSARGFVLETMGRVHMPWLADAMRLVAHRTDDVVRGTIALWLKTGFAQYLVASRG